MQLNYGCTKKGENKEYINIKGSGGQKNLNVFIGARQSCKLVYFHYLFTKHAHPIDSSFYISILPISISMSFLFIHFSSVKSRLFAAHPCSDQQ